MDRDMNGKERWRNKNLLWLLLIPYLVLYVPMYNSVEPQLFGFPFFYWFQLAWIFASMFLTAFVFYATQPR